MKKKNLIREVKNGGSWGRLSKMKAKPEEEMR